jgi:hypothetical protein
MAVDVGVRYPETARGERLEVLLHGGQPGDRQGAVRGAVVGHRPADHLVLLRLADQLEVLLRGLPCRLHRLSPTGGEEDPVQIARREVCDPLRQLGLHRGGVAPHREVGQLGGLLGGRLGQHATPVPDLDDEEPGQAVQDLPALVVPDVGTLPAGDHRDRRLRMAPLTGEVHPQVVRGTGGRRVRHAGRGLLDRGGHLMLQSLSFGSRQVCSTSSRPTGSTGRSSAGPPPGADRPVCRRSPPRGCPEQRAPGERRCCGGSPPW